MEIKGYIFSMRALSCSLIFTLCLALLTSLNGCSIHPLSQASRLGDVKAVRDLLESDIDVYKKDKKGKTALMFAAHRGHTGVVRILLERGADVNAKDRLNQTSQHFAAAKGRTDVVHTLLERGADVNAKDYRRWTPLHYAAHYGRTDVVRILLDKGANPRIYSKNWKTPLSVAEGRGLTTIVNIFRKAEEERYMTVKKPIPSVPKIGPVAKPAEVAIEPVYEEPARIEEISTLPKTGKYYAVVIGIGKYQHDRIPKLKYTTVDAEEMYKILTDL